MDCIKCHKPLPEGAVYCPYCGRKQAAQKYSRRGNGAGSVYKLGGRRKRPWAAVKDGVYIGYYSTKTEAVEAVGRLAGSTIAERYNWSFKTVYERWKQEHYQEIGQSGIDGYERAFDVFEPLHNRKFRELRAGDFQAVLDQYQDRSVSTVSKYKNLITQMSEYAMREEIIQVNFAKYVTVKGRARVGHVPMDAEDVRKLYEAAGAGDEAARVVCCLLSTGMRIGELFKLRLDDYHGSYCVGGEKTDAGRDRIIPIRTEGREHFEYFAEHAAGHERLIDGYNGQRDAHNFRSRDYAKLIKRLGIDKSKTPHSARVTYTTNAVDEGLAPEKLQKVLGHSDFAITQKYYNKPDAAQLVQAVEEAQEKKKPGA